MGAFSIVPRKRPSSLQRLLWLAVILLVALIGMVAVLGYHALVARLRSQLNDPSPWRAPGETRSGSARGRRRA
jgi:hypothetical protein